MLHTLHTIVAVGGIAVFAVFLFGFLMKYAARRLLRQGLFFTLVCCGFLHSMATKPEPEPTVDFAYAENGDGTVTLMGIMGEVPSGKLVVPTIYDDYDVTGIGDEFAAGLGTIKSVVIPEGIESVGESAFIDNQLTEIVIPASLTEIGAAAFGQNPLVKITVDADNPRYETVASGKLLVDTWENSVDLCLPKPGALVVPEGIATIGKYAFEGVAPTSIVFPSTLAKLEESAFGGEGMKGVTKLDFSTTSLAKVGDFAFWNCAALAEIIFPSALYSIGEKPFLCCSALKKVTFMGEEPSVGEGFYYADKTGSNLVPATTYVQPGQGWDDIVAEGKWQDRPISLVPGAVAYWTEPNEQDGGITLVGVASGTPSGTLYIPSTYNGQTVTAIDNLFYKCSEITKVVFPPTLKRMLSSGFERCPNISDVVFNEGLEEIGSWAFNNCDKIKSLHIPSTVTKIGKAALNCRGVESITVGEGNSCFYVANGCLVETETEKVLTCVGKKNGKGFALVLPEGAEILGAHALRAASFTSIVFPTTLRVIEPCAIAGSEWTATDFDLSACENLTTVGDLAFGSQKGALQTAQFPASLEALGAYVFAGCSNLKSVSFLGREPSVAEGERDEDALIELEEACPGAVAQYPDGDIYIGKDCKRLPYVTTYVLPAMGWDDIVAEGEWQGRPIAYEKGAVAYEYNEVAGGIELTALLGEMPKGEYVVPSSYAGKAVVGIGEKFLEKTSGITSLVVPEGVCYIGREAFHEIDTLSRVSLPSTLTNVDEKVFCDCYKLATIEVADGNDDVNVVGGVLCDFNQQLAVVGVNGITSLTLPRGITRIGKQAFCACTKLVTADLSASELVSTAKNAFAGCTGLTTVRFPATFALAEAEPFLMCAKLKEVHFLGEEPEVGEGFYWLDEDDDSKLAPATTFVRLGQGWDEVVAEGKWQGRPIAYEDANPYLTTGFCAGSEELGTISGGDKRFKSLSTVKLTAKADKGYVFAGWYYDVGGTEPAEGENDYRSTTFQFVIGYVDVCLYAKFLPVSEDYCGDIMIEDESEVPQGLVYVDSGSLPTVTVSGLPTGLTYNKTTGVLVLDEKKMKAGDYAIVISATNAGGYKNDRVVTFVYGEVEELELRYAYTVGETVEEEVGGNVTGLPMGLKCVKTVEEGETTYMLAGTPTKAGRFKAKENGEEYYIRVDGAPSKYVEANADGLPTGCKVTGSGVYAAGAKATLKATAAKGMVFAGWYEDPDFDSPVECDADYRNPTLTITDISNAEDVYYPRFIELKYDYCGEIWIEEEEVVPQGVIFVESESLPTVTVTGLPKGLTFDKKTGALVFNEAQMKAGDYAFVISATNAGGYKNNRVVTFQYDAEPTYDAWWTEYAVGQIVSEVCGPEQEELVRTVSISMKGLPAGLKLAQKGEDYFLEGFPTKPGRYAVVCTYKGYAEEGGVLVSLTKTYYMIVQGAPSRYVEVVSDGSAGCKATGSGVYAAGAAVKTSATAARGSVFANWNVENPGEEGIVTNELYSVYADSLGKDGDPRVAAQTWLVGSYMFEDEYVDILPTAPDERYVRLIARFVGSGEDELEGIAIHAEDDYTDIGEAWNVRIDDGAHTTFGDDYERIVVSIGSVSAPKLTVKGTISGITIKNYGTWAELYCDPNGKTMPKPGEYTLTLTAVNQSKQTDERTLTVRVPNQLAVVGGVDVLANLDTSAEGHFALTVGETLEGVYADDPEQLTLGYLKTDESTLAEEGIAISSIAVSGLPSGVTCKNGVFAGSPTKAGVYTMTVTATCLYGGKTVKATATAFFRVEAIDPSCVGTFNGELADLDGNPAGTFSATVSDKGKLTSCKLIDLKGKATSITLKTQEFSNEEGYYLIVGTDKDGNERTFEISPAVEGEDPSVVQLGGTMYAALGDYGQATAQQNVWSDKAYKAAGMLPNIPAAGVAPDEWDDDLELLFKPSGAVTVKRNGKSGSARFELTTYNEEDGWTGSMTVNVPDGTPEGYCRTFAVSLSKDLKISQLPEPYPYTEL